MTEGQEIGQRLLALQRTYGTASGVTLNHDTRQYVARTITEGRKRLGFTQDQLAEAAGMSVRTVSNTDQGGVPQQGNLLRLLDGMCKLIGSGSTGTPGLDGTGTSAERASSPLKTPQGSMLLHILSGLPPEWQKRAVIEMTQALGRVVQEYAESAESEEG